jgi:hypothetical protein
MILAFLLCAIPTLVNIYLDRNGRKKQHKIWIKLIVIAISLALAVVVKVAVDIDYLRSLALMWGFYLLAFDYGIVWVLRKRGVIRKDAKVFEYTGESTYWYDQLVSKVHPVLRLVIRVALFCGAIYLLARH